MLLLFSSSVEGGWGVLGVQKRKGCKHQVRNPTAAWACALGLSKLPCARSGWCWKG